MTAKDLKILTEIFPKATFEAHEGLWIYDKSGAFIGAYINEGFSLSMSYKHVDKVKERLQEFGYRCWWHEIFEQAEHDRLMDEVKSYS